jgi:DMSO/TMAO reductase YedYZ molybdopterin-dependent catalytic subunit
MTDDNDTSKAREIPAPTKLTTTKQRWAREGKFLTGHSARPDAERLPPGQHLVKDWPVLDLGEEPNVRLETWRLDIAGALERPVSWDWAAFQAQPQTKVTSDIHCVTTWSRYDNAWEGVLTRDVLAAVMPKPDAHFVMLQSYDGYTTNLPLEDFAAPDAILARSWQGKPLTREHGGPLRLVVPHLYFWKSAKWIKRIELVTANQPGYWEQNGYHMHGDPWQEQRYTDDP